MQTKTRTGVSTGVAFAVLGGVALAAAGFIFFSARDFNAKPDYSKMPTDVVGTSYNPDGTIMKTRTDAECCEDFGAGWRPDTHTCAGSCNEQWKVVSGDWWVRLEDGVGGWTSWKNKRGGKPWIPSNQ